MMELFQKGLWRRVMNEQTDKDMKKFGKEIQKIDTDNNSAMGIMKRLKKQLGSALVSGRPDDLQHA